MSKRESKKLWPFIWEISKVQIWAAIIFTLTGIVIYVICCCSCELSFTEQWSNWLEIYSTFGLIGVSIVIWYNEQKRNWVGNLPKKLDIFYIYQGEVFCKVENAPLSGESDIRNWGQSIGQTILQDSATRINFSGFKTSAGKLNKKKKIVKYKHEVFLKEKFNLHGYISEFEFDDDGKLLTKSSSQKNNDPEILYLSGEINKISVWLKADLAPEVAAFLKEHKEKLNKEIMQLLNAKRDKN